MDAARQMSGVLVRALMPQDERQALLLATRHARQEVRRTYGMTLGDPATAQQLATVPTETVSEILPRLAGPDADSVLVQLATYTDEFAGERFRQLQQLAEVAMAGQVRPE